MFRDIIIKVLVKVAIFKDLSSQSIVKLAYLARINHFDEGVAIFNEGDPGDCLYIIASGNVDLYSRTDGGDEIKLQTLGVTDVFGEMALLDGLPRSATVKAATKTILFYINRTDFNIFLTQNPDVALKLIETVSIRLRETNKKLREISDEKEKLKIALMEVFSQSGEKAGNTSDGENYFRETYKCPYCEKPVKSLKVKNNHLELEKIDDDFCPHYNGPNPVFYEAVVCPGCGFAFNDETMEISPQAKKIFDETIGKWIKPINCTGKRSLEQAIEAFNRLHMLHGERNIKNFLKADICLKLAWLHRYKEDRVNEKKYLLAARQRFLDAYEEEKYEEPQKGIYSMYMIGQICLNTGDQAEALKWLNRVAQHPQKDQAPQLAEKARQKWQAIKQANKDRKVR